ncbi:hypothetical protein ASU31_00045 [Pedobacter ginsenosidimutans]|uniref:DUF3945 domain-containing protein n=1 Tax=Pedobacter ginsenosidimutans TaxID=687842 RepID=A0A0T5VV25_9SPHI|nr:hypothetical protein [Pedobacter ginsenosidimutans]KRT17724.1 hypothetical protein ASU31_00045 [Pedobacter ginsenosidimutans]
MNEQNLEYLKKSLDYLGFGTKLNDVLESAISREIPAFTLGVNQSYTSAQAKKSPAVGSDQMRVMLNFNRSNQSDMYFLNDYEVTLLKAGSALPIKQVFDLERDNRITALQAYKLLSGNSLERDVYSKSENGEASEKKKVWFKLNLDVQDAYGNHPLKKFYPEFKFDLSDAIDKYPFKGLTELGKEGMMKMLRSGNMAQADMLVGKKSVAVFITANPQYKGLDVYDKNMVAIRQDEIFPKAEKEKSNETSAGQTESKKSEITASNTEERFPWENQHDNDISQNGEIGR